MLLIIALGLALSGGLSSLDKDRPELFASAPQGGAAPPAERPGKEPDLPTLPIVVDRLGDRVAVARYAGNNVAAVATARGIIVVDAHQSPTILRACLVALAGTLGRDDWRWLVNTHGHWDHTWGNQALAEATGIAHARCAEVIAAHPTRARMAARRRESSLADLRAELALLDAASPRRARLQSRIETLEIIVADLRRGLVPTPPDITFEDRYRIAGGDRGAELIFCGEAHTDHDLFVFVPGESLLFCGDLFNPPGSLGFTVHALTETDRLLRVIDDILARAPDRLTIVPGHGEMMSRDVLVELREELLLRSADLRPSLSAVRRLRDGDPTAGVDCYYDDEEFHTLASCLLARGRLDAALAALEVAVAHLPDSALLHAILGETHLLRGDEALARRHYERALALFPQHRGAARDLKLLE